MVSMTRFVAQELYSLKLLFLGRGTLITFSLSHIVADKGNISNQEEQNRQEQQHPKAADNGGEPRFQGKRGQVKAGNGVEFYRELRDGISVPGVEQVGTSTIGGVFFKDKLPQTVLVSF